MKPAAPIFDGTADTFDCDLCGNAHPRIIPDEDGVHPDARGGAYRLELLIVGVVVAGIAILIATGVFA